MRVAAILLAAGRSTRFGAADKLATPLEGIPLGGHAARTLLRLGLSVRLVVTGAGGSDWPGFERVLNDRPEAGMGRSVALGVAAARARGAAAVLIALADMPRVPEAHFRRLLARDLRADTLVASTDGDRRLPPALFGARWFAHLEVLEGDRGARALLERAELVETSPDALVDVDRPADLARLG